MGADSCARRACAAWTATSSAIASRFGEEWLGDSWSWDDLPAGYAAPYSGLIFNENVVRLRIAPGTGRARHSP